jgi:alpha-glucosidase
LRRERRLGRGSLEWEAADASHLSYANGDVRVLTNFGTRPLPLPPGVGILLASEPDAVSGGALAANRTVWVV